MKRKLILFTALILLITMAASMASADISNIKFDQTRDGKVKISWKDSGGSGPYQVTWAQSNWKDWYTWEDRDYDSTSATIKFMVPGATYDVTVSNDRSSKTVSYTVPKTTFTEWKTNRKVSSSLDTFDVETDSIYKIIEVRLYHPRLSKERRYFWLMCLRTPKGYASYVHYSDNCRIATRTGYVYWDNIDMAPFIENVRNLYGKVPTGDYAFEMYLNGQYYGAAGFYMYGD